MPGNSKGADEMTPTLNVNLEPCKCPLNRGSHRPFCRGPVLIPCPLPPKVEFTVRLGECDCNPGLRGSRGKLAACAVDCPARPVRVTCDIGGDGTWAGSEVESLTDGTPYSPPRALRDACRERWALVKALVLGQRGVDGFTPPPQCFALMEQRDAVFAALCKMAKAESEIIQRFSDIDAVYTNRNRKPFGSVAADELAAYVSHLIATVGALT